MDVLYFYLKGKIPERGGGRDESGSLQIDITARGESIGSQGPEASSGSPKGVQGP